MVGVLGSCLPQDRVNPTRILDYMAYADALSI